ncbi:COR domain-containing protein [Candidatus Halobeggiatoa sp. HSG11]|nr:COR domain-containing protein [Candidatus Halobeggiatoa sp. HSG11]
MSKDLDIIKKLEKKLNIKFEAKFSKYEETDWNKPNSQYELNDSEQVIKLRLHNLGLTKVSVEMAYVEIAYLVNLQHLDLGANQLSVWPVEMANLVNLQQLNLRANHLSVWPVEMAYLVNLQELELSYNHLSVWPVEMANLVNLQQLDLGNNKLSVWPVEMANLVNLRALDLDGNQLSAWPVEMAKLENLHFLNLRVNKLSIPPEILDSCDPTKITNYYIQLAKNRKPLNEAKMLIVGQGGVGKTSLVNRLTKDIYNDAENKTEGIQINQWQIKVKAENIRLNIWDFGGQEIMHATHQFFLTKRSLYILVLDARQGEQESRVEYWLKLIQSFGGDSPIIIAINKTDQHPLDINKRGLKAKYPSLKTFFDISCKTNQGIPELVENLKYQLDNLEHVHDPFPSDWFQVKQTLEDMDKDYIDYAEYIQICEQQAVADELSQQTLIGFLHDLGIVLNFRDDQLRPQLRNTNILNPEWVTQGVYKLLNSFDLNQNKGVLKLDQLANLLNQHNYPADKQCIIIDMMEKFELCFEIQDSNRQQFLIPELLAKEEPDINWDYENSLAFQYHYDVLPSSIMSRFIVRMQQLISKKTYWHSGVVLVKDGNKALVKSDVEDKKVFIWVTGKTSRKFLTQIRKQFEDLHQSIPKINAIEQVPYKTEIIAYEDLLISEEMGKNTFFIPKLREETPISKLLDGIEKIEIKKIEPIQKTEVTEPSNRIVNFWQKYKESIGIIFTIVAAIAAIIALI